MTIIEVWRSAGNISRLEADRAWFQNCNVRPSAGPKLPNGIDEEIFPCLFCKAIHLTPFLQGSVLVAADACSAPEPDDAGWSDCNAEGPCDVGIGDRSRKNRAKLPGSAPRRKLRSIQTVIGRDKHRAIGQGRDPGTDTNGDRLPVQGHRLKVSSVADEQTVWAGDPEAPGSILAHVLNAGCGEALSRSKLVKPAAIVSK